MSRKAGKLKHSVRAEQERLVPRGAYEDDGQTLSCGHTHDGTVCAACLGGSSMTIDVGPFCAHGRAAFCPHCLGLS